jgi:tyrosine decarboxylase/aspartate 1-decarboxylase
MNVVGIKSDTTNAHLISNELRKLGWSVSLFPKYLRVIVMPHTKTSHIKRFLDNLQTILENLN